MHPELKHQVIKATQSLSFMMNVLYHSRTLAVSGGRIHIDKIIENLKKLGNKVDLVEPVPGGRASKKASFIFRLKRKLPLFISELLEILYNLKSYRELDNKRKEYDIIYERHTLFNKAGMKYAKKHRIPFVLEVNSPMFYERKKYKGLFYKKTARTWERQVFHAADKIICVSERLKEILIGYGVDKNKIVVMHNAIDPEECNNSLPDETLAKYRLEDKIVVGFVGYMLNWHGGDCLLKVLRKIMRENRSVVFLLVGKMDHAKNYKKFPFKNRVKITGQVEHKKIFDYINTFDIAVMPNSNEYGSPMKIIEYLGAGNAVVGPRVPAVEELITSGKNGLLIKPNDEEQLYIALKELIKNTRLKRELGKNAKRFILSKGMTWENNAKKTLNVFKELISDKKLLRKVA